ncbi:arylsulfatase I-like [Haemaphysalis longicornis]
MALAATAHTFPKRPHIIFILADDLGRGDTSVYGSPQIPTPNIDALACTGVVLNNYYVQPVCAPSRGCLMTGLYAIHTGLQHNTITAGQAAGLPLDLKILPEHLKDLGYETHIVGKWNLGYSTLNQTPTYRGFDTFYGQYNGPVDYYTYVLNFNGHEGIDFFDGLQPVLNGDGEYLTELLEERAEYIIANRNKSQPMFLFLAHQATHSTSGPKKVEAPEENIEKFPYIGDVNRTTYAGMVDAMDQSIGALLGALEEASMLEESIIVFSSDNGAVPGGYWVNFGSNWPLRGMKGTLWEGGIRGAAFIWSPLMQRSHIVSSQLMHITDWLPTLYSAAGGDIKDLGHLDGFDMWQALSAGANSPRTEILHNIDSQEGTASFLYANFKVVVGSSQATWDGRYQIPGGSRPYRDLDVLLQQSQAASVLGRFYGEEASLVCSDGFWRRNATVYCGRDQKTNFFPGQEHYLFDIAEDPCELRNIANVRPDLLSFMLNKLKEYNETAVAPVDDSFDPRGFPENNGGLWGPWLT